MVKDTKLYDILNVSPKVSSVEIRKAYRLLALRYHPDKNNHSEESKAKFLEVCEAYEILNDEKKRSLYDRYGTVDETAIQQSMQAEEPAMSSFFGAGSGMSAGDLFADFFDKMSTRSFGGRKTPRSMSHGPDIKHDLKCSLSSLYEGKTTKLGLNRRRTCKACQGRGSLKVRTCKACRGRGQQSRSRKMGPMMQTWTQTCAECNGSGSYTKNTDVCTECQGEGCIRERKIFDVEVKPGMCHGQVVILPGEADEVIKTRSGNETVIPGDVIITITQAKDEKFRRVNRNGCDLVVQNCKIPLVTSLCGGSISIDGHPNGKLINVSILPGELIRPGQYKSIEGLGMPKYEEKRAPDGFGNLYIQFQVEYPEKLAPETVVKLRQVLNDDPNVKQQITAEDNDVCERVDDCIEMEDHVLSNFVPDFDELMRNEQREDSSRKRRHYDDPETPESDESGNCATH